MKTNPFKNASWHWWIGRISICCLQTYLADVLAKTESPIWVDVLRSHAKTKCFFHKKNFTLREGMMINHQRNSPLNWLNTTTRGTTGGTVARGVPNPPRTLTALPVLILPPSTWGVFCGGSIYLPWTKSLLAKTSERRVGLRCWGLNQSASS